MATDQIPPPVTAQPPYPHAEPVVVGSHAAGLVLSIFRGGLAAMVAGVLVTGVGGRLIMRFSAATNPEQDGAITEAGNAVGRISAPGTIDLVVGNGLFVGLVMGFVWIAVREWLPASAPARLLAAATVATLTGGSGVIDSGNLDFRLLSPAWLHIMLFLALVALGGAATAAFDSALKGHLPTGSKAVIVLSGLTGLAFIGGLPFVIGFYFGPGFAQVGTPPWAAGLALIVVAAATVGTWSGVLRHGSAIPTPRQRLFGRGGLVLFAALGGAHLATQVSGTL